MKQACHKFTMYWYIKHCCNKVVIQISQNWAILEKTAGAVDNIEFLGVPNK